MNEWISVQDRLPEDDREVYTEMGVARFSRAGSKAGHWEQSPCCSECGWSYDIGDKYAPKFW